MREALLKRKLWAVDIVVILALLIDLWVNTFVKLCTSYKCSLLDVRLLSIRPLRVPKCLTRLGLCESKLIWILLCCRFPAPTASIWTTSLTSSSRVEVGQVSHITPSSLSTSLRAFLQSSRLLTLTEVTVLTSVQVRPVKQLIHGGKALVSGLKSKMMLDSSTDIHLLKKTPSQNSKVEPDLNSTLKNFKTCSIVVSVTGMG